MPRKPKQEVIVGGKYNDLTVISFVRRKNGRPGWLCVCKCGNETDASTSQLVGGGKKTCGCSVHEGRNKTHGYSALKTKEYMAWKDMKKRCYGNGHKGNRKWYKDKGIIVCERWKNSFIRFLEDVGYAPGPNYSIDRINNDGNYEPGNVRWATPKEQVRNSSRVRWVEVDGERKILDDWCEEKGIDHSLFLIRLSRGWTEREAILTPPGGNKSEFVYNG